MAGSLPKIWSRRRLAADTPPTIWPRRRYAAAAEQKMALRRRQGMVRRRPRLITANEIFRTSED